MRLAMLNWPPIRWSESNNVTLWPRCARGRGETGRAGTDNRDILPPVGRLDHQLGLAAGTRVDQAAGLLVFKNVVQAGLVAGDAGVDFVDAAATGLEHPVRIGQK